MFKFFAVVFAAILALAVAAPKPGVVSYSSPVVAAPALTYGSAYAAPVAYSGYPSVYSAAPVAYTGYSGYGAAPLAYY